MASPVPLDYHDVDGTLVAFIGDEGNLGVLQFRQGQGWLLHTAGSVAWDAWHQAAFRNRRSSPVAAEELRARGFPTPEVPEAGNLPLLMDWAANFRATLPLTAVPAPVISRLSDSRGVGRVFLVLQEDLYESSFGDGKFLTPAAAFWEAADARAFILRQGKPGFTVKTVKLRVDAERRQLCADLGVELYEHYSIEDVVRLLSS